MKNSPSRKDSARLTCRNKEASRSLAQITVDRVSSCLWRPQKSRSGNGQTQSRFRNEATEIDRKRARYINDNLADYLVPVNADVKQVDVILAPEIDHEVNPAGVKGLGELANVGTAAAIANAVYHATGNRVRRLPIRMESLLSV